ncbi:891_t:CDS:2, partial [Racocetra persica]
MLVLSAAPGKVVIRPFQEDLTSLGIPEFILKKDLLPVASLVVVKALF